MNAFLSLLDLDWNIWDARIIYMQYKQEGEAWIISLPPMQRPVPPSIPPRIVISPVSMVMLWPAWASSDPSVDKSIENYGIRCSSADKSPV